MIIVTKLTEFDVTPHQNLVLSWWRPPVLLSPYGCPYNQWTESLAPRSVSFYKDAYRKKVEFLSGVTHCPVCRQEHVTPMGRGGEPEEQGLLSGGGGNMGLDS